MQRAKHADRKRETRTKIMIGEAAQRVGAFTLPVEEIEALLAHYVETGGGKELQTYIKRYSSSAINRSDPNRTAKGGSEATRRGGAEIEPMDRAKSVLQ